MAVSIEEMNNAVTITHQLTEAPFISHIEAQTGDFAGRDYPQILSIINNCAAIYLEHTDCYTPEHIALERDLLVSGVENFRLYVNDPQNYRTGAAEQVRQRYQKADAMTGRFSPLARMAARVDMQNLLVVMDVDGTLTDNPLEYLLKIPGSEHAEPLLERRGREYFAEAFTRVWQPLLRHAPSFFYHAGSYARQLEGTDALFEKLQNNAAEKVILSANFLPVVEGFLDTHIPHAQTGVSVWAITDSSLLSTDKGTVLKHIAQTYPEKSIVYIGDGSSCIPATEAAEFVALYLARAGLGFEKRLKKDDAVYAPYETHHDSIKLFDAIEQYQQNQRRELVA